MLKSLYLILYMELLLLWRRSHEWLYPLFFFIMLIILLPLALTTDKRLLQTLFPGYLWIAALLASLLSIQHLFFTEIEEGHLTQLLFSELPLPLLLLVKLIAQWLVTELPLILLTPFLGWFFDLSPSSITALCISFLLGTPILTLIGSVVVTLTFGLRQQGVLIGLLMLPLTLPVLILGVAIVQQSNEGFSIHPLCAALAGLMILSATLLPFAMSAALKFSLED